MKNIELKVKVGFSDLLNRIRSLNLSHVRTSFQKDTYYLVGDRRLKIREEEERAEIIYYERQNIKESKDSCYFILKLNRMLFYCAKLALNLTFGVKRVVEKQRELYLYRDTRIHLDKVGDLGEFLELETVVRNENKYDEYQKEQNDVINLLNLNKYQKFAGSYSDMVTPNVARKNVLPEKLSLLSKDASKALPH